MKSHRVTLRPLSIDDLPYHVKWVSDEEVMRHITGETTNEEKEKEWVEKMLVSKEEKVFMILDEENEPIGNCAIHFSTENSELQNEEGLHFGLMIGEKEKWGQGYAAEALIALSELAQKEYGQKRVWLTVDSVHDRAIKAYEKAGFQKVRAFASPERRFSETQWLMEKRFD